MGPDYDVIGMGVCAFDLVIEVGRCPGPDEKLRADSVRQQGGGLVGTALVAAARLGGRCAYLGALGDDTFGNFCVSEFEKEGVDTRFISRPAGASALVAVIVADRSAGTRMILWTDEGAPRLGPDAVSADVVRRARVLHVDNYFPEAALAGARLARSLGVTVTMDLERQDERTGEFLSLGDYAIVPEDFARLRYGSEGAEEGAQALYEEVAPHGGRAAVVTCGVRGSYAVTACGPIAQPAYRAPVVDTTGCGDVYHGAFALGLARGWELGRIMQCAAAAAALKCRKLGGRAGIPTMPELEAFLRRAETIR
jgi:sulfofructose kinase